DDGDVRADPGWHSFICCVLREEAAAQLRRLPYHEVTKNTEYTKSLGNLRVLRDLRVFVNRIPCENRGASPSSPRRPRPVQIRERDWQPSTVRLAPLIQLARVDARKATAAPTPSARPNRPNGSSGGRRSAENTTR